MGWGRTEGVLRKAFIEKGSLEQDLEGRASVYHVERGYGTFQAEELPKQSYMKNVEVHGFWGEWALSHAVEDVVEGMQLSSALTLSAVGSCERV